MRASCCSAADLLTISTAVGGLVLGLIAPASSWGQLPEQPIRLELQINGETFTIDSDKLVTLKSEKPGGPKYQVAARAAQYQPWNLNTVSLEYHRGFAVEDDEGQEIRTATFRHRLGFAMTISDLGGTLDAEGKRKTLELLTEATTAAIRAQGGQEIETSPPTMTKLGAVVGLGVTIRSVQRGVAQRSIAYVLTGERFAATAVIQFLDADQATVLPLIKPTLQSIAPLK